jgi:hypothetical protein
MELLEKYENYGFLDNVKENKKDELSELFENFTNYLLKVDLGLNFFSYSRSL